MNCYGMARVTVCSPVVAVGNPEENAHRIIALIDANFDSDVIVFPELCMTGYTCADLFQQQALIRDAEDMVLKIAMHMHGKNQGNSPLVFVGAPVPLDGRLYNCAVAIKGMGVIGIVPKQFVPNYKEFYERRWFAAANGSEPKTITYAGRSDIPFGIDLFFKLGGEELVVFAEICEDLWMPIPPSSLAAVAGANLLVNLSASNETVAKDEYRMELIRNQSGRCIAGYAYASAGPSESTTDLVFSGHCVIAENGNVLADSPHIGDGSMCLNGNSVTADVDVEKLNHDRQLQGTFGENDRTLRQGYRMIEWFGPEFKGLKRPNSAMPFVPMNKSVLDARCSSVFDIQCAGLAKRIDKLREDPYFCINIGVSGGLDSTHALLVAHKTVTAMGLPPDYIRGITMPGFGTTGKTRLNAVRLMSQLGIRSEEIDIRPLCMQAFRELNHKPFGLDLNYPERISPTDFQKALCDLPPEKRKDLIFENIQARMRTFLLMSRGFVLGTGDLSELALGWCTYNGDHMSMYNVNCSLPKTLIKFMVEYVATNRYEEGQVRDILLEIAGTTISPELLPPNEKGEIAQSTEDVLGPYILHDYFLYNFLRNGYSPEKILWMARQVDAFKFYGDALIVKTLKTFIKRFFTSQFKRSCVPDGPKVGSVSLSPRGDWRMPSDADMTLWLDGVK